MSTASELVTHDIDAAHVYQDNDQDRYSELARADSTSTVPIATAAGSSDGDVVDPPVVEWVAIIDQNDDSTAIWAGEIELMRMRDLKDDHDIDYDGTTNLNTNIITRPPTPPWSRNQPWVANLETINVQCINNLNMTFQSSSNTFGLDNISLEFGDEHELEDDLDYVYDISTAIDQQENDQISLDLLEQAFEQVRQRANAIIDEAKSKAMAVIKEQIPPHLQTEAVGWYAKSLNVVMAFLGYIGKAMKNVMPLLTSRAKDAWVSILRTLRVGVAKRAIVAAQGVRNLQSVRNLQAQLTAGEEGGPVRVWVPLH